MFRKRFLIGLITLIAAFLPLSCFAIDDFEIIEESKVQKRLNNVGVRILNSNKIDKRIVFAYDKKEAEGKLDTIKDKTLLNRQIAVYGYDYKFIEDDNEDRKSVV